MEPRRVVILALQDLQALDLVGPAEVFEAASRLDPTQAGYRVEIVTPGGGNVRFSNGITIADAGDLDSVPGEIDTFLIPGGWRVRTVADDEVVMGFVRDIAARSRRVTSVCTGATVLAAAGLLDGKRVTTHWAWCDQLASEYPAVEVEPDPIFVRDGNVITSAGVTAGMDLALALVEEDMGRKIALEVARWLVMFVKRPGGQSQFSAGLAAQMAEREPLRDLQAWIPDHLAEDLTVPALAERAYMSPRNFARAFRREVGVTPAVYVETLRVERARTLLESGEMTLEGVARECGFGAVETLRRAFHRRVKVGPAAYRSRFRTPQAA